ncbi:MAG: bifunctional 23S rRNA (guanine(2069)-N(7))-methyltransferase RlmK/23S rRNA (guanine(2445)-N(2))-methyltransferase RlmL [Pirellulales bacterium]
MLQLLATCAFGIESSVRYELIQLGYDARIVGPGRVQFDGDERAIARANLWLRTADRVLIVVSRFTAGDFDALFETTKALPWEAWIPANGAFPVRGRSRHSRLTSVPAVQRSVKRAIVDRLMSAHKVRQLPEDGPLYGVEIALLNDEATLTIDTTGPSLHKRGYRQFVGRAPMKETLAAALVQLSFWQAGRPLIDPFCGSGTIAIEAALIGRNIAPGLQRDFPAEFWPRLAGKIWNEEREAARATICPPLNERVMGTDIDADALRLARRHAEAAGVTDDVHFQQRSFADLTSKREYGCVIANPPYGARLGEKEEVASLHRTIPEVLRALPTWSHYILTAQPEFEKLIGKTADRRRKLFNGRIECTYYQFHGPKPGVRPTTVKPAIAEDAANVAPNGSHDLQKRPDRNARPAFGGMTSKTHEQAELFRSRLSKRARHLRRWPSKRDIHCYRLYERDIPEVPLVVDRYEDHVHIVEYERPHERDVAEHADWLDLMRTVAGESLDVDTRQVFCKHKGRQRDKTQHEKTDNSGYEIVVREGGLRFVVNLTDYVDTGLFLDHRIARGLVRDASRERRILNLFAYTGAFSVYAAKGFARSVTTVDWSTTYLDWARRNFSLNGLGGERYEFVRADAREFLDGLSSREEYDVVVIDPPTFSNSKRTEQVWDVQRDHAELLRAVLRHTSRGGVIYFSTNFRRFQLDEAGIPARSIHEISRQTVPEDFRNRRIHRCWVLEK